MTDLQALLDATPDGETCVIPAGDHTIPEGVGLSVPHGVAAVDATGATIRVVGADGRRSTMPPTVPLFDCGQRPNGSTFTFRGGHIVGPDTSGWDDHTDVPHGAIQWSFYKTWDSTMVVENVTAVGGWSYGVSRSGGGHLRITNSTLGCWVGGLAFFEGHGGHGDLIMRDVQLPAPSAGSKFSSIGCYIHPHLNVLAERVTGTGWNRWVIYMNGSPVSAAHQTLIDVDAVDCGLIQSGSQVTTTLVRCTESGGGSFLKGDTVATDCTWEGVGCGFLRDADYEVLFVRNTTQKGWEPDKVPALWKKVA